MIQSAQNKCTKVNKAVRTFLPALFLFYLGFLAAMYQRSVVSVISSKL